MISLTSELIKVRRTQTLQSQKSMAQPTINKKRRQGISSALCLGNITQFLFGEKDKLPGFSFQETKEFEFLHTKYVTNCALQCLFGLISICSAILEYEHTVIESQVIPDFYVHTHVLNDTLVSEHQIDPELFYNGHQCARVATFISLISSVFLWVTIVIDFIFDMQIAVYPKKLKSSEVLSNKFTVIMVVITLVFFFPSPNPFSYGIDVKNYSDKYNRTYYVPVNAYLTSLVLCRMWFILKIYLVASKYYTPRIYRICKMNSFKPSLSFPLKCFMACDPFVFDSFLFVISLFFCAYNLRIFERYLDVEGVHIFANLLNDLWCIFITMGTLGFGDYSPSTWLGRVFIMIGCLAGVLLVSVVVVSVSSYLNIHGSELNVYTVLNKAYIIDEKNAKAEDVAIKYIIAAKNRIYNRRDKLAEKKRRVLLNSLKTFGTVKDKLNATYNYSEYDNILEHMKFLENRMRSNRKAFKTLVRSINELKKLLYEDKEKNSFNISKFYNERVISSLI